MRRFYLYSAIFGISFIMVFVPIVVPMLTREADYSVFNGDWNGSSSFYKDYVYTFDFDLTPSTEDIYLNTVLKDLSLLPVEPSKSIILIIGPSRTYGGHELSYLRVFLEAGGIVVLADDFGIGNEIMSYLGLSERFSNTLLLDLSYASAAVFPLEYGTGADALPYVIALNYASTITGAGDSIIMSSPTSFLDTNENSRIDKGEPRGPFTLAARVPYGDGELYLLSDPSIFINASYDEGDNAAFVMEYLCMLWGSDERSLYIDEAHFLIDEEFNVVDVVLATNKNAYFQFGVALVLLLMIFHELPLLSTGRAFGARIIRMLRHNAIKEHQPCDARELAYRVKEDMPEWDVGSLYSFYAKFRHDGDTDEQ